MVLDSPTHNALTNGTHTINTKFLLQYVGLNFVVCSHVRPTALYSSNMFIGGQVSGLPTIGTHKTLHMFIGVCIGGIQLCTYQQMYCSTVCSFINQHVAQSVISILQTRVGSCVLKYLGTVLIGWAGQKTVLNCDVYTHLCYKTRQYKSNYYCIMKISVC